MVLFGVLMATRNQEIATVGNSLLLLGIATLAFILDMYGELH